MRNIIIPPPHREQLPKEQVDGTYKRLRFQVFIGIFIGYAAFGVSNLAMMALFQFLVGWFGGMGWVVQSHGWNSGFEMLIGACLITIILMALTHKQKQRINQSKK